MTKTYNIDSPKTAFLMVGPPCAGKSTFANKYFAEHEIWGLDKCRKLLLGVLEFPKTIDAPAASLLNAALDAQILGETTVCVDQTNLNMDRLRELRNKFRTAGYTVVVVKTLPVDTDELLRRNQERMERTGVIIPDFVIRGMQRNYEALPDLSTLGDFLIDTSYEITRGKNVSYEADSALFIGDLHGQFSKFREAIKEYGYLFNDDGTLDAVIGGSPKLVFVGDLVDRGTQNIEVVRAVKSVIEHGFGYCVQGNHDLAVGRLMRDVLNGKRNLTGQSPQSIKTADEFRATLSEDEFKEVTVFLETLPPVIQVTVRGTDYIVSHAGVPIREGRISGSELLPTKHDNVYIVKGYKTGEKDEEGRFAVTPIQGIGRTSYYKNQVYGHLNQSEKLTGTFQVPFIYQDSGGGSLLIAVESSVERSEAGKVGFYLAE